MRIGELRSHIDSIWSPFWSSGISNLFESTEKITYLLFALRLDDIHTLKENKSVRVGQSMVHRIVPIGRNIRRIWQ